MPIKEKLEKLFIQHFGSAEGARSFFSPSRINLIGEHIDYNGGQVFPCAIDIGTYAMVRPRQGAVIRLYSENLQQGGEISLPLPPYEEANGWMNYPVGVAHYLAEHGWETQGFDAVVWGNIPNGAGLSSSASLELLFGEIINRCFHGGRIPRHELVQAGVWCENAFFGLHTGIMDQYVIGFGKKDYALLLDTRQPAHEYIPFVLGETDIVILNTNYRRELKDSKYNERRAECEAALAILQKHLPIQYLCEVKEEQESVLQWIEDPVLRARARHVVRENFRVQAAVKAMQQRDWVQLGAILRAGNASLRDDYEVTGPALDAITEAANQAEGCYGARMTGAGFGGCAIALVQQEAVDLFCEQVAEAYQKATGLEAQFLFSHAGDGTRELLGSY